MSNMCKHPFTPLHLIGHGFMVAILACNEILAMKSGRNAQAHCSLSLVSCRWCWRLPRVTGCASHLVPFLLRFAGQGRRRLPPLFRAPAKAGIVARMLLVAVSLFVSLSLALALSLSPPFSLSHPLRRFPASCARRHSLHASPKLRQVSGEEKREKKRTLRTFDAALHGIHTHLHSQASFHCLFISQLSSVQCGVSALHTLEILHCLL